MRNKESFIATGEKLKKITNLSSPTLLDIQNNGCPVAKELAKKIYNDIDLLRSLLDDDYSNKHPLEYSTNVYYGEVEDAK